MQKQMVLYIASGIIVVAVFIVILIIFLKIKLKKNININPANDEANSDEPASNNYESIIKQIKQVNKYKSILFASAETGVLPVTIPVNTAIGLAKEQKRCLLIDLDLSRDAVAKVFGLNPEQSSFSPKSIQSGFENLWIWPAHKFSQSKQMNLKEIVKRAMEKFDLVLINAPALVHNLDRRQIISAAEAAFVCTKDKSDTKKLEELIKSSNCKIIGRIPAS